MRGAPTIAILPFANLTQDAAMQSFADGLGNEATHAKYLRRVRGAASSEATP
jgi:TolB-like protein